MLSLEKQRGAVVLPAGMAVVSPLVVSPLAARACAAGTNGVDPRHVRIGFMTPGTDDVTGTAGVTRPMLAGPAVARTRFCAWSPPV